MNSQPADPFEQNAWNDASMSALLEDARNGNPEARERLMSDLKRYLDFLAHHQFDRELQAKVGPSDIVQETMLRAVNGIDQFRGRTLEEFRGWLKQILINEARQMKRDWHTQKRNVNRETGLAGEQQSGWSLGLADSLPTPGTQAARDEQTAAIHVALAKLGDEHRQLIQWRNWEGLSLEQIAERLDVSVSTASRRFYQALVAFKELLKDDQIRDE